MKVVVIVNHMMVIVMERIKVMHVPEMPAGPVTRVEMMAGVAERGMESACRVRSNGRPGGVSATGRETTRTVRRTRMTARPLTRVEMLTRATE